MSASISRSVQQPRRYGRLWWLPPGGRATASMTTHGRRSSKSARQRLRPGTGHAYRCAALSRRAASRTWQRSPPMRPAGDSADKSRARAPARLVTPPRWSARLAHADRAIFAAALAHRRPAITAAARTANGLAEPGISYPVLAAAVGASRVCLGVRWPGDVQAGWLFAEAWLCLTDRAIEFGPASIREAIL